MLSPIIGFIYLAALIVIVILIVVVTKKRMSQPKQKGQQKSEKSPLGETLPVIDFSQDNKGEQLLCHLIKEVDIGERRTFTNIYVPKEDGTTGIVPMVMLCASGLYVLQYMDLEGWILGREESKWWTHFVSTDEKDFINNPIWENDANIGILLDFFPKTLLSHFHSYIVFSDKCELRSIEGVTTTQILNLKDFAQTLEKDLITREPVFKADDLSQMGKVLSVLDKADQLEVRLQALKAEMEEEQRQKAAEERQKLQELKAAVALAEAEKAPKDTAPEPMLTTLSQEEKEKAREERRLKKHRPEDHFTRSELALRDALVLWRKQQADAQKISVFELFDNRALDGIVNMKPKTLKELRTVPGFDTEKCNAFGSAIITMVGHAPK